MLNVHACKRTRLHAFVLRRALAMRPSVTLRLRITEQPYCFGPLLVPLERSELHGCVAYPCTGMLMYRSRLLPDLMSRPKRVSHWCAKACTRAFNGLSAAWQLVHLGLTGWRRNQDTRPTGPLFSETPTCDSYRWLSFVRWLQPKLVSASTVVYTTAQFSPPGRVFDHNWWLMTRLTHSK